MYQIFFIQPHFFIEIKMSIFRFEKTICNYGIVEFIRATAQMET